MSHYGVPPVPPPPGAYLGPGAAGPLVQDVACRKCGYNLRGLDANGRCPECGTAVGYSLQGDLLRFCDPGWVDTLHRGARTFIWGVVLVVLGAIGAVALAAATNDVRMAALGGFVVLAGWVMTTVGWWFLTQPDPSGLGEDKYGTARKVIRVTLILGVVSAAIGVLDEFVALDPATAMAVNVLVILLNIAAVVGVFAQLYYLERLALRIPDPKLSARAHFLMYAFGVSYTILLVLNGIMALTLGNPPTRAPGGAFAALGCVSGILGIAVLVFAFMYLRLVENLGKRFKEQAQAARASWAASAFSARAPGQM